MTAMRTTISSGTALVVAAAMAACASAPPTRYYTLLAADLRDLPPATIINAGIDPLESDGEKLARRLRDGGTRVTNTIYPGATHEFFGMAPVVKAAAEAQALATSQLREAFSLAE